MKTLLLLSDGIGLRNFIMTRFTDLLALEGEVTICHTIPESLVQPLQQLNDGTINWLKLPDHQEGHIPYIIRRAKILAQLKWQKEPGTEIILEYMDNRVGYGFRWIKNLIADLLSDIFCHSSAQVKLLDTWHQHAVKHTKYFREYVSKIKSMQPDIVFCSHQRSEIAVPIMLAAHELAIPTCTFIYSWDNLPKGRMAVYADFYFVWSQHMKDEMLKYYPDVEENQIIIVGTPQFEHYFNPDLIEAREKFLRQLKLDPNRPVICFSGDDLTTSPYDPYYLADLAEALRKQPENERPQVLFRRNPTDMSSRYEKVLERYPEICISSPEWVALQNNDWSKVVPTEKDTKLLTNVVKHCDLVVNVASTMALDFSILGKPCVYLFYNPESMDFNNHWSIEKVYQYPHFNHFNQFNPVYWVHSRDELSGVILHALQHPQELKEERERWARFLVQTPYDQASTRCVIALRDIVRKP